VRQVTHRLAMISWRQKNWLLTEAKKRGNKSNHIFERSFVKLLSFIGLWRMQRREKTEKKDVREIT
jgi:hypothetical protein